MTNAFVTQGSQLYIANKTVSPNVAVVIAQLQGLDAIGGMANSIDVTNFDSPGYKEYFKGLVDPGKPSGNVVFDFNSTAHSLLHKLLGMGQGSQTSFFYGASDGTGAPTVSGGVLVPPGAGSPSVYTRSGFLFDGFVAEFTISAQLDNIVVAKLTLQASGARKMAVKGASALV